MQNKYNIIHEKSKIGKNTKIWYFTQVREYATIGDGCNIGMNVYIDKNVVIGNNVKIQNNVSIWDGVIIEDDVFIGPSVVFTNDLRPRSFRWNENMIERTIVRKGASLGANSTIVCGNRIIGEYAMVAAGSVVTKDVPSYGLVRGNPARLVGFVCVCGHKLKYYEIRDDKVKMRCTSCGRKIYIDKKYYDLLA